MHFCFKLGCAGLGAAMCLSAAAPEPSSTRVASVVRADPRTGRLVRKVSVTSPATARKAQPVAKVVAPAMADYVQQTAERYQVDPLLVHSVIEVESNYNPLAVSPKGARGLMQLMPGTARRLAVKDSLDPFENIDGGVRYLKYLLTVFGEEDPRLALAAYNAGEGAVARHGGIPPYPETERYVQRVGLKYGAAKRATESQALPKAPPPPEHPPIEQYIDAEGRLHARTRSGP